MARITAPAGRLSSPRDTPTTRPWASRSSSALPRRRTTPSFFRAKNKASITSAARSEQGKTRPPRSVFRGTPKASKYSITAAGGNRVTALYRKRPFRVTCASTPSGVVLLVRLHRPLPVMYSLRPSFSLGSRSTTAAPARRAASAAIIPAAPPPTTTTGVCVIGSLPPC